MSDNAPSSLSLVLFFMAVAMFLMVFIISALLLPYGPKAIQKADGGYHCNFIFRFSMSEQRVSQELLPIFDSKEAQMIKDNPEFQNGIKQILADEQITVCDVMAVKQLIAEVSNKQVLEQIKSGLVKATQNAN